MRVPSLVEISSLLERRGVGGVLTPDAFVGSFDGPRVVEAAWSGHRLVALGRCAARASDEFAVAFLIEDKLTVEECTVVERNVLDRYQSLLRSGASGPRRVRRVAVLDTSVTTVSARLVYPYERVVLIMRRDARLGDSTIGLSRRAEVSVRRAPTSEVLRVRNRFADADEVGDRLDARRLSSMSGGGRVQAYVATEDGQSVATAFVVEAGMTLRVIDIYTCRSVRKQGVASLMLDWIASEGDRDIEVAVSGDNVAARALYDSCGFMAVDRVVERSNVEL